MRLRDTGITVGRGTPGPLNAITDVPGVRVGHATLIDGEGPLVVGRGPVRTGVTVILPHDGSISEEPLFAGRHRLSGNGEMTGAHWIDETGMLMSPIGLTNTHSVGIVRDALVAHLASQRPPGELFWCLPVVAETWDGMLSDVNGQHVRAEHVGDAIAAASGVAVAEGGVGGGTGMICHGFKGGIGTASRVTQGGSTVGVLVQANQGRRGLLRVDGAPAGEAIPPEEVPLPEEPGGAAYGSGSIVVIAATDAPLLPTQCSRLAQRAALGVARVGGVGEHWSGDLFLCFATGNRGLVSSDYLSEPPRTSRVTMLADAYITDLFDAVVEATEEAILNCLVAAETMTGRDGITAHGLDPERLREVMAAHGRPAA